MYIYFRIVILLGIIFLGPHTVLDATKDFILEIPDTL